VGPRAAPYGYGEKKVPCPTGVRTPCRSVWSESLRCYVPLLKLIGGVNGGLKCGRNVEGSSPSLIGVSVQVLACRNREKPRIASIRLSCLLAKI